MNIRRKKLRFESFDYATHGEYFVTICTQNRLCLFGEIVGEENSLSPAGEMVTKWWHELATKYEAVETDEFVVMPNHVYGVIWIVGADLRVGPVRDDDKSLPAVMQWSKTMTTNAYIRGVREHKWPAFEKKLWQRSYYERIVRNDRELHDIRQYVRDNPRLWAEDEENPERESPP